MSLRYGSITCTVWLALGCGGIDSGAPIEQSGASDEEIQTQQMALQVDATSRSISYDYAHLDLLPGGVAGGLAVVFIGSPLEGRVLALSRLTGTPIGELPPPPNGFVLPFIMHKEPAPGRIVVLDAGGLPSPDPFIPAIPSVHEYKYSVSWRGELSAELVRTISFEGNIVGFAEDVVNVPGGGYLVSDAILGAVWVVEPDGDIRLGLGRQSDAPEDAIPELAFCPTMPLIEVGGIPFLFSGSTLPGVSPLAIRDGTVYFYSPCAEGLYSFPLSILSDNREPWERAEDIELVAPKPPNVEVEQLLGLTFNPYVPWDRHLYAADSLQLQLIRIDVETGARQVVADDPTLFNFPSSTAFLPPIAGVSPLVVVSNQQHRTPLTNDAITEDMFQPPFIATKVFLLDH